MNFSIKNLYVGSVIKMAFQNLLTQTAADAKPFKCKWSLSFRFIIIEMKVACFYLKGFATRPGLRRRQLGNDFVYLHLLLFSYFIQKVLITTYWCLAHKLHFYHVCLLCRWCLMSILLVYPNIFTLQVFFPAITMVCDHQYFLLMTVNLMCWAVLWQNCPQLMPLSWLIHLLLSG